jgi:hypothetical protein
MRKEITEAASAELRARYERMPWPLPFSKNARLEVMAQPHDPSDRIRLILEEEYTLDADMKPAVAFDLMVAIDRRAGHRHSKGTPSKTPYPGGMLGNEWAVAVTRSSDQCLLIDTYHPTVPDAPRFSIILPIALADRIAGELHHKLAERQSTAHWVRGTRI